MLSDLKRQILEAKGIVAAGEAIKALLPGCE